MKEQTSTRLVARRSTSLSEWVAIEFVDAVIPGSTKVQTFHGLRQVDAVHVLALHENGSCPLVRQFRPIIGEWSWELPGGMVDAGEDPATTAARELCEETGLIVHSVVLLLSAYESTARLTNRVFGYFALVSGEPKAVEPDVEVTLVGVDKLRSMAAANELGRCIDSACVYAAAMNENVRELCKTAGWPRPAF